MKINIILMFTITILFSSLYSESIEFSADSMRYESAEGKEYTLLSGKAYVKTGSKDIHADEIRLFGKDYNILVCNGNVTVTDSEQEIKISSETLYYDRLNKLTRINKRSVMEDYKNEMVIKSGFMEYKEVEDLLTLQIGVRILKEDLTCRCEFAIYDKKSDTLEMTGLPIVYKKNDTYRASRILVILETDEIQMDGKVEGSLEIEGQEKDTTETETETGGSQIATDAPEGNATNDE